MNYYKLIAIRSKQWTRYLAVISLVVAMHIETVTNQITYPNTPPVMHLKRNIQISELEKNGTVIDRVEAHDNENDPLQFGLESAGNGYPSSQKIGNTIPFRIDEHTGVIYLNQSLVGLGGENFFIYVTVSDGKVTAKNEVYVNIKSGNNTKYSDIYNPREPSFTPRANISGFLPPFHLLPGVQQNRQPSVQFPPSSYPLNFGQQQPPQLSSNQPHQIHTYVEQNHTIDGTETLEEIQNSKKSNSNRVNGKTTSTSLTPIKDSYPITNTNNVNQRNDDNRTTHGDKLNPTPKIITDEERSNKAILPIIITVCAIFLAAGIVALIVFRKQVCNIGKSLKKKSKAEMAKKSVLTNGPSQISNSSTMTADSMVLPQWTGPRALENRYVNQRMQVTSQLSTSSSTTNSQIKSDRWEFPRHRLKFFNILGEGAFGQVWRCEATDIDGNEGVTTVAVKTLKENATEIERNDLHSELQVMKSLEPHVNVVRLLGSCTEKEPIFVILEYVNNGKLQTYLRNSRAERHYGNTHGKSNILTSGDLTSFMYQVARGMDFLSSRGIIHRDLAARNILITDEHTCKVADFGFARDVITSKVYERKSEGKLPIRWMAIESLYDNIFSVKSDIWSFGILMWEIVTLGSTPYPGIAAADVMRKVRDGYRLEKPEHCRRELYNIMYYCWSKDSNERPTFTELVQLLDKLLLTEMDYIELERFPDHNYYNMLSLSGEKL